MTRLLTFLVILLLIIPAVAAAQPLTETEINNAIKMGENDRFDDLVSECTAGVGFNLSQALGGFATGIRVSTLGSLGRIARVAKNGKRMYKPVTLETIPEDLKTHQLFVMAEPMDPDRDDRAPMIEHVVLKTKEKPEMVLQPESVETEPVEWSNLFGGKWGDVPPAVEIQRRLG